MFMNFNDIVLKKSFITRPQMVIRNPSPTHNNVKVQNSDNKSFDTVQIQRWYLFLLNVRIHCLGKHLYPPSNFPSIHDTNPKKISFVTLSMEVVVNVSRKYKTPTKRLTLRIPRQTLYRYYQTSYI